MNTKKITFFLALAARSIASRGKNPFFDPNYPYVQLKQRLNPVPALPKRKLCFLLGCGRSGTTLLSDCLNINNNILGQEELHIAPAFSAKDLFEMYFNEPLAMYQPFGYFHTVEKIANLKREEMKDLWFEMIQKDMPIADMYSYLHHLSNKKIVLDKTPLLPLYGHSRSVLKTLLHYEPVFIYLIRNPLDVISSYQKMYVGTLGRVDFKKKTNPKIFPEHWQHFKIAAAESTFRYHESVWYHSNLAIKEFLKELPSSQVCQLTFEEFLQNPEIYLKQICQKLDIEFSHEMVQINKIRKPIYSHREIINMVWNYDVPVGDINRLWSTALQLSISPIHTQKKHHQWNRLLPQTQILAESFGYLLS